MSALLGGPKFPDVAPAPPAPTRSDAERAGMSAAQRARIRRALGRRETSTTGSGAATSNNSGLVRLLGGTS